MQESYPAFFLNKPGAYGVLLKSIIMKSALFPVGLVTIFLVVYVVIAASGFSYFLTAMFFTISPILVIWMVFSVLKSPNDSRKTFNDHFYEDNSYRKIPDEAENA